MGREYSSTTSLVSWSAMYATRLLSGEMRTPKTPPPTARGPLSLFGTPPPAMGREYSSVTSLVSWSARYTTRLLSGLMANAETTSPPTGRGPLSLAGAPDPLMGREYSSVTSLVSWSAVYTTRLLSALIRNAVVTSPPAARGPLSLAGAPDPSVGRE